MIEKHTFQRGARLPRQTVTLLEELGVNCHPKHNRVKRLYEPRSFWCRFESQLNFILYDAWRKYRERLKLVHPDNGGQVDKCVRLNRVWGQVKTNFAKHGVTLAVLVLVGCRTPLQPLESPIQLAAEQSPPMPPLAAPGSVSGTIAIVWDYPGHELSTNITFKLYHCTNLLTDQFTVFTNVSGLLTSIRLPVEPGVHFFKLTAASLEGFGESDFSEAARCQLPRRGGLEIQP